MTLSSAILSALTDDITSRGGFTDELLCAILSTEGEELTTETPVAVDSPDYPTRIVLRATANHGAVVEVVYTTNAGTPNEHVHVAGKVAHADRLAA